MSYFKLMKVCRYLFRYKSHPKVPNLKPTLEKPVKMFFYATMAGTVIPNVENGGNVSKDHQLLLTTDFLNIEAKILDVIKTLHAAVVDTCEKYRSCLEKQMEIIEKGKDINPASEYWDPLVEIRNEAADLKRQFETYLNIIEHIGQASLKLALCSSLINTEDSEKYISNDFFELARLGKEQAEENKKFEAMLLEINMNSILRGKM